MADQVRLRKMVLAGVLILAALLIAPYLGLGFFRTAPPAADPSVREAAPYKTLRKPVYEAPAAEPQAAPERTPDQGEPLAEIERLLQ